MVQGVPTFKSINGGGVRVRHKEFIQNVVSGPLLVAGGTTPFYNSSYSINPGLQQTFPWLSGIACQYQTYKFNGLLFEFKSTSGSAISSTNASLGSVAMATNYDATAPLFLNKRELMATEFASVCAPSQDLIHPVECKRGYNVNDMYYVRRGQPSNSSVVINSASASASNVSIVTSNADLRFNDVGTFQLCTEGMQGGSITLGELWVTYDVTLSKPIGFNSLLYAHYKFNVNNPTDMFGLFNNVYQPATGNATQTAFLKSVGTPSIPPTLVAGGSGVGFNNPGTDIFGLKFLAVTGSDNIARVRCYFPNSMPAGNYKCTWIVQTYGGGVVQPTAAVGTFFTGADSTKLFACSGVYYPTFGYNGVTSNAVVPLPILTYGDYNGTEYCMNVPGPQLVDPNYASAMITANSSTTSVINGQSVSVNCDPRVMGWRQDTSVSAASITTIASLAGVDVLNDALMQVFCFQVNDNYEPGHYIEWLADQAINSRLCLPYMNTNFAGVTFPSVYNGHFFLERLPDVNP